MKKIAIVVAALASVLVVWLLISFGISRPTPVPTASEYVVREAAAGATATAIALSENATLRAAQQNAERDRWVQPAITGFTVLLIVAAALSVMMLLAWLTMTMWQRRRPLVTVAGELVSRRMVEEGQYPALSYDIVRARGIAEIEAARRIVYPQTFSPHLTDNRKQELPPPPSPPTTTTTTTTDVPSFAKLLDTGRIAPGTPLLMGYAGDGKEQTGGTSDLFSMIISGVSGSGKTNTTAVLLSQAYLTGCAFIVCDPHSEADEDSLTSLIQPLAGAFVLPVASSYTEILRAVQFAHDVMRARLSPSSANAQQKVRAASVGSRPLLLIIDEANTVLSNQQIGDAVTELLTEIYSEGRKVRVYGAALAQSWLAARSGGSSALRDTAASKYIHRLPRKAAGLLLPTDLAPKCEYLPTGAAILARRDGSFTTVTMPLITADDIIRAAAMLGREDGQFSTSAPTSTPTSNPTSYRIIEATAEVDREVDREVGNYAQNGLNPEMDREVENYAQNAVSREVVGIVAQMMADEASQKEILLALGWATSGGAYDASLKRLRAVQAYIARRAGITSREVH